MDNLIKEYFSFGKTKQIRFKKVKSMMKDVDKYYNKKTYTTPPLLCSIILRNCPRHELSNKTWANIYFIIGKCYYFRKKYSAAVYCFKISISFKDHPIRLVEFLEDAEYRVMLGDKLNSLLMNDRSELTLIS